MIPYLNLSGNWQTFENPGGPWTLMKRSGADANAFQISSMQRQNGRKLDPEPNLDYVLFSLGKCRWSRPEA